MVSRSGRRSRCLRADMVFPAQPCPLMISLVESKSRLSTSCSSRTRFRSARTRSWASKVSSNVALAKCSADS